MDTGDPAAAPAAVSANRHHGEMETLLSAAAAAAILVICAVVTNWFSNTMYRRCRECGTLNARRRTACRQCGHSFETGPK